VKVKQGKTVDQIEATPFCLLFGQGHQHFLDRLAAVPRREVPPPRGRGKKAVRLSPTECLAEALFQPWTRQDPTFSFRWDPAEDVRYALMYGDPSNAANKEGTQHGDWRPLACQSSPLRQQPVAAKYVSRSPAARGIAASRSHGRSGAIPPACRPSERCWPILIPPTQRRWPAQELTISAKLDASPWENS
jgi:hypothetical protein